MRYSNSDTRHGWLRQFFARTALAGWLMLVGGLCSLIAQDSIREAKSPKFREVYVPLSELDRLLERDKQGVLLSRSEFAELLQQAGATSEKPQPIVVRETNVELDVTGGQAKLVTRVEVEQFADGWQQVVLPIPDLPLESAEISGQPARLGRDQGAVKLLHDQAGQLTVTLEQSAEVTYVGSDQVVAMTLAKSLRGQLRVQVPEGKQLLLDGLAIASSADGSALIPLGNRKSLTLRWTDSEESRSADALVFGSTAIGVQVAPGELRWNAQTQLKLFGQSLDELRFDVPQSLEIADVTSTGLEAWELIEDPENADRTTIRLKYRQPFSGSREVQFRGISTVPVGELWSVPSLRFAGATVHNGRILIQYPRATRLVQQAADGVRRAEDAAVPQKSPQGKQPLPAQSQFVFDMWREDFQLDFVTQPKERELHANVSNLLTVNDLGADLEMIATLDCLYAPLFGVDIRLPAEWQVNQMSWAGQPVEWKVIPREAGTQHLQVELPSPLNPGASIPLTLSCHRTLEQWPLKTETAEFDLPVVEIEQANAIDGTCLLKADDRLEIVLIDAEGLTPTFLGLEGERSSFRYQSIDFSGVLSVKRRPSQLVVRTLLMTRLDRDALRTHFESSLEVTGGGLTSLDVSLPEDVSAALRFTLTPLRGSQPTRITEQIANGPADGRRSWTLKFDQRLHGQHLLAVDVEIERAAATEWVVPTLNFSSAQRENGHVAIEADSEQQLTMVVDDGDGGALPLVDPLDMPPLLTGYRPQHRVVGVYRFVSSGPEISITEQRLNRVAVPTAIGDQLGLTSLVGRNGQVLTRCRLDFRAVGAQGIRVQLDENDELWASLLDGEPIEVRRQSDATFVVPLPMTDDVEATRSLVLFYGSQLEDRLDARGAIRQNAPALMVDTSGLNTAQPLEILQAEWEVQYPDDVQLIGSSGRFRPDGELSRISLLGLLQGQFHIQDWTQLKPQLSLFGFTLLAVFIVAAVVKRWRWKGVLLALCLLIFAGLALLLNTAGRGLVATKVVDSRAEPKSDSVQFFDDGAVEESAESEGLFDMEMAPMESAFESGGESTTVAKSEDKKADRPDAEPADAAGEDVAQLVPDSNAAVDEFMADMDSDGLLEGLGTGGIAAKGLAGARLSVRFDLPEPSQMASQRFEYLGAAGSGGAGIEVDFEHKQASLAMRSAVALGVVLFFFLFVRRRSLATRCLLAVGGIFIPLGLITFVPVSWHLSLDGVLFGSIAGVFLWCFDGAVNAIKICWRSIRTGNWLRVAMLLFVVGLTNMVMAQEANDTIQVTDTTASPVEPDQVRTIFVPYDDNSDPLSSSRVYLPQSVFRELWNRAHPEFDVAGQAPVPGMISGAIYVARLVGSGETAVIEVQARMMVHSFRSQPIELPIPLEPVALSAAQLDDQPAAIRVKVVAQPQAPANQQSEASQQPAQQRAAGQQSAAAQPAMRQHLSVVVPTPGNHVLDLKFRLPVSIEGPAGQFQLPTLPVIAGRLSFELPAADLEVSVNNSRSAFRRRADGAKTWVDVPVDRGGRVNLAWLPRTSRDTMNVIVHGTTKSALHLDDTGLHLESDFQFQVRQGSVDSIAFTVSPEARLQTIRGADVGGWEMAEADGMRTLTVFLRRTVDDSTSLRIELFQTNQVPEEGATSFEIPTLEPRQLTRESGVLGVYSEPHLNVRADAVRGLRQINVSEYQSTVGKSEQTMSPALAYRYQLRPFRLTLRAERRAAEGTAVTLHAASVERRRTLITSLLQVSLTGTPRSRFNIRLPFDYTPQDVDATGIADWFLAEDEFDSFLVIELQSAQTGTVEITLQGTVPRLAEDEFAEVDVPQLQGIDSVNSSLGIWFDPVYAANLDEVEGWKPVPVGQLSGNILSLKESSPQFGFNTDELETYPVSFLLRIRQPRLQGDVVSLVTTFDTSVDYAINLKWTLKNAPTDRFRFSGPDWLQDRLQIRADGVRNIDQQVQDDGRIRWTITTREPRSGSYFALATATLPPPADGTEIELPELLLEVEDSETPGEWRRLTTLRSYGLLVNQSPHQLNPPDDLEADPITIDQLPIQVPEMLGNQAAFLLRFRDPERLASWRVQRVVANPPTPASVNLAELITVIAHDGSWRTQATYRTRNRLRQFLPLLLPTDARILSAYVAGRPVRPVQEEIEVAGSRERVFLVAMPSTSAADTSFEIRIVLSGQLTDSSQPNRWNLRGTQLELPVPQVVSLDQNRQVGIPVMKTRWDVYLPEEWDASIIDSPKLTNMSPEAVEEAEYLVDLARVKEAQELLQVLKDGVSATQKYKAYDNVVAIQRDIEDRITRFSVESDYGSRSQAYNKNAKELERENRELKAQLEELQEQQLDALQDQQQSMSANGVILNNAPGNAGAGIEIQNRAYVDSQNDFLFGNNASGIQLDDEAAGKSLRDYRFRFRANEPQSKPSAGKGQPKSSLMRESKLEALQKNFDQLRMQNAASNSLQQQVDFGRVGGQSGGDAGAGRARVQSLAEDPFGTVTRGQTATPAPQQGQGVMRRSGRGFSASDPRGGFIGGMNSVNPPAPGGGFGGGGGGLGGGQMLGDQLMGGLPGRAPVSEGGLPNQWNRPEFAVSGLAFQQNNEFDQTVAGGEMYGEAVASAWTADGGLSLDIEIPTGGKRLTLTKIGGRPQLALRVRSQEMVDLGVGTAWSMVWLGLGLFTLLQVRRSGFRGLLRSIPVVCILGGSVMFFGFGIELGAIGFVLFLLGCVFAIARTLFTPASTAA